MDSVTETTPTIMMEEPPAGLGGTVTTIPCILLTPGSMVELNQQNLLELQNSKLVKQLERTVNFTVGSTFLSPPHTLFDQAQMHHRAISQTNAENIIEVGTHACYYPTLLKHLFPDRDFQIHTFGNLETSATCVDLVNQHFGQKFVKFILGNSTETLSSYEPPEQVDLAWIDGSHQYGIAYCDLVNCHRLGIPNVLVDDYLLTQDVKRAVDDFCNNYDYHIHDKSPDRRCIVWLKSPLRP